MSQMIDLCVHTVLPHHDYLNLLSVEPNTKRHRELYRNLSWSRNSNDVMSHTDNCCRPEGKQHDELYKIYYTSEVKKYHELNKYLMQDQRQNDVMIAKSVIRNHDDMMIAKYLEPEWSENDVWSKCSIPVITEGIELSVSFQSNWHALSISECDR